MIKTVQVKFENRNLVEFAETAKEIPCDLLIISAGFLGYEDYIVIGDSSVQITRRNSVVTL